MKQAVCAVPCIGAAEKPFTAAVVFSSWVLSLFGFGTLVGPIIGGIPIALFSLPMGLKSLLWGLGVTILVQQIEGYFLSPRLMGEATGLHPVSVLLLLSAGGLLFGLGGMVAAVPAYVCLRGAARVLWETRKQEKYE